MENTTILRCNCKHEFQDNTYGKSMRLHNKSFAKGKSTGKAKCTVCGDKKGI